MDDLLDEPVFAVELNLSAVNESHEFIEGAGFFDCVHGTNGREFLSDIGRVFYGAAGLFLFDGRTFSLVYFNQLAKGLTQSIGPPRGYVQGGAHYRTPSVRIE